MASKRSVLIIEDDRILSNVIKEKFEISGFSTSIAIDGMEGLKKSLAEHPDVIVLDILLPKMDGIEVLKSLRNDTWGKDVPVICLSNLDPDAGILESINQSHPSYYLIKSSSQLGDVVEKARELVGLDSE